MAKHYYSIEVVTSGILDEEDVADLESVITHTIKSLVGDYPKVSTEYVDSEG